MRKLLNHPFFSILAPAFIGFLGAAYSVKCFDQYGWSLFLILPIIVSFLSALFYGYKRETKFISCWWAAVFSIVLLGCICLLLALDGLICLLMALPLALILALPGAFLGWFISSKLNSKNISTLSLLICSCFPLFVSFEHAINAQPSLREVRTEVLINASKEKIWDIVVAFPTIAPPENWIFRSGVAYPIEAEIVGNGIGAIRYCRFSTGDFVEPITKWNNPHLLAFNVTKNPMPIKEFSIYKNLHANHSHGHMISEKGQFELVDKGDKVLLVGTTWYRHSISPEFYWGILSDYIIHKVHERVLNHIKTHSENS